MNTTKFGAYVSKLRKQSDLTQSQLADMLNVTRQAVSKWEMGDSFPDISLLPRLTDIFRITVDQLMTCGEPGRTENEMKTEMTSGASEKVAGVLEDEGTKVDSMDSPVNVAPALTMGTLDMISESLGKHGINIAPILELAVYTNEMAQTNLLKTGSSDQLDENLLEKFIPFLTRESKETLFYKIIDGELNSSLLVTLLPYLEMPNLGNLIDAAVLEGRLDASILKHMHKLNF